MRKGGKMALNQKPLLLGTGVTLFLLLRAILGLIISSMVSAHVGETTKIHSCVDTATGDARVVAARALVMLPTIAAPSRKRGCF